MSLSVAASVAAGVMGAIAPPSATPAPGRQVTVNEEEVRDVNLGTFYIFDKEHTSPRLGDQYARARSRSTFWWGCRGYRSCGRGCRACCGCIVK
jgi:hypothetical protein